YTYRDLTSDMPLITEHWKSIDLKFDAIYSGFLGSIEQIDIVKDFVKKFKTENNILIADPCMADLGKMYVLFNEEFAKKMTSLCSLADIILPNITEACFMTDTDYIDGVQSEEYINTLLNKLLDLGAKNVILTGVSFHENEIGAACMGENRNAQYYFNERIPENYHGTGDVFASAFSGALLNGFSLYESMCVAVRFTCNCIKRTKMSSPDTHYGVDFERGIPYLLKELKKI
ncbi:MAG: bifunctional hydroxymethylpyrimidine kinase/phosphomethylpyrimidine kinase, partial [Clostridia bacterium]|nr:bifunctional hydroxymethylpyrimidine kinase/phosphomethylpyrimidine kinase [Clostridia bacterium]